MSMIISLDYCRSNILRGLGRAHPYYSHASSALEENLWQQKRHSPLGYQKNIVSVVHKESSMGGTGIFVNKEGFLFTSLHLIRPFVERRNHMRDFTIITGEKKHYALDESFLAWDEKQDLAMLRALGLHENLASLSFASRDPYEGEQVVYFPFPNGHTLLCLEGTVEEPSCDLSIMKGENIVAYRDDCFLFQGRGDLNYSGSGIFSPQGEFLGIICGGENPGLSSIISSVKAKYGRDLIQAIRHNLYRS